MKSSCNLQLRMPDAETARNIAKALELDNAGYVESEVEGNIIRAVIQADNIMALKNTVDDYLACLSVAKSSLDSTHP